LLSRFIPRARTDWREDALAIVERQSIWRNAPLGGDAANALAASARRSEDDAHDDLLAREPQWAAWKVAVVVVVFCAAFWSGIGYIATRLLG
jgi:hypothetical protein